MADSKNRIKVLSYPMLSVFLDEIKKLFAEKTHKHVPSDIGLGDVTNNKQIKGLPSGTTDGHVVAFGTDGYTVKDTGFTLGKSVPSNALFTDTTYKAANANTLGLVKSSTGANKVSVETDGIMSLTNVSTDILSQGSNVLILNGGGAD